MENAYFSISPLSTLSAPTEELSARATHQRGGVEDRAASVPRVLPRGGGIVGMEPYVCVEACLPQMGLG